MVVLVTAGLFPTGCGQQEQGQVAETTEETTSKETTAGETIVEDRTQRETATAAGDGEQAADVEDETAPPAQAATPWPSNGENQLPDELTPSQEPGFNEAGQDVSSTPAVSPADSIVFLPLGNGLTYSCTGGPPFVHDGHDASMGNCAVEHVGPPAGLVCDIPTLITIVHDIEQLVVEGSICHSGADAGPAIPKADLPDQAYSFGTEPAPYAPS